MKLRELKELKTKSEDELKSLVLTFNKERFNLRIQRQAGQLENPARLRELRRDVARAKTLIAQKQNGSMA